MRTNTDYKFQFDEVRSEPSTIPTEKKSLVEVLTNLSSTWSSKLQLHRFHQESLTSSEKEYREQKMAFEAIPPLFLSPHRGRFVAVRNGEIMDSDTELAALTNRFFGQHGDVPVYIGKVDEKLKVSIDTPFLS